MMELCNMNIWGSTRCLVKTLAISTCRSSMKPWRCDSLVTELTIMLDLKHCCSDMVSSYEGLLTWHCHSFSQWCFLKSILDKRHDHPFFALSPYLWNVRKNVGKHWLLLKIMIWSMWFHPLKPGKHSFLPSVLRSIIFREIRKALLGSSPLLW